MSPLWRDEVAIFLSPNKIALARLRRGVRPTMVASTEALIAGGHVSDVRPAFAKLAELLSEPEWQNASARVIVANQWARYGIVPWPEARLDGDGRLTHARYVLADTFGDTVADWSVALADTPPGRPYVACAMPGAFKGELDNILAVAHLKLVSLRPQLIVSFNAWRHRLPPDDAWFVSLDQGSLTAVHLANGLWDRVHMARLSTNWTLELERLRVFGRLTRATEGPTRMLVDAPVWMRHYAQSALPDLEWLDAEPGDGTHAYELALLQRCYA